MPQLVASQLTVPLVGIFSFRSPKCFQTARSHFIQFVTGDWWPSSGLGVFNLPRWQISGKSQGLTPLELKFHQIESLGDRISTAEASYSTSFLDHCFQEAHLWLRLPSDKNQGPYMSMWSCSKAVFASFSGLVLQSYQL